MLTQQGQYIYIRSGEYSGRARIACDLEGRAVERASERGELAVAFVPGGYAHTDRWEIDPAVGFAGVNVDALIGASKVSLAEQIRRIEQSPVTETEECDWAMAEDGCVDPDSILLPGDTD